MLMSMLLSSSHETRPLRWPEVVGAEPLRHPLQALPHAINTSHDLSGNRWIWVSE